MAMAAPSFGGQNVMLMRNDVGSSNSLVAMLTSCSVPHVGFQVARSGGGLEDAIVGCGQKRAYYPTTTTTFDGTSTALMDQELGDDDDTDLSHPVEKKRRLSFDQVRSLERNFEMENKLEPERKMQLAKELGLQPRQVAVWFQNRRARWKTKQLERDYETLNSGYLKLKADFEAALLEKDALKAKVQRLSGKTTSQDSQASSQCESEAQCEGNIITTTYSAAPPSQQEEEIVVIKEQSNDVNVTTASSDGSNDESSSELLDADSPRTSDSNHDLAGYCNQFAPESFVGPGGELAFPVKLEDGPAFQVDPSCSYFLPPIVEQAGVLPWWDWP